MDEVVRLALMLVPLTVALSIIQSRPRILDDGVILLAGTGFLAMIIGTVRISVGNKSVQITLYCLVRSRINAHVSMQQRI